MNALKKHLDKIRPNLHKKLKKSGFYEKVALKRDKGRDKFWKDYHENNPN